MIIQKLKNALNFIVTTDLKSTPFNIHFLLLGVWYFITHPSFLAWAIMVLITASGYIINDLLAQYLNPDYTEDSDND